MHTHAAGPTVLLFSTWHAPSYPSNLLLILLLWRLSWLSQSYLSTVNIPGKAISHLSWFLPLERALRGGIMSLCISVNSLRFGAVRVLIINVSSAHSTVPGTQMALNRCLLNEQMNCYFQILEQPLVLSLYDEATWGCLPFTITVYSFSFAPWTKWLGAIIII